MKEHRFFAGMTSTSDHYCDNVIGCVCESLSPVVHSFSFLEYDKNFFRFKIYKACKICNIKMLLSIDTNIMETIYKMGGSNAVVHYLNAVT